MLEASTTALTDAGLEPGIPPGSHGDVLAIATMVDMGDCQHLEGIDDSQELSDDERRIHRRIDVNDLWWLGDARVKYGAPVALLDLSVGGALVETDSPLKPGMPLVLELQGLKGPILAPGRVVRCKIVSLNGRLRYRGACEFKQPLNLPDLLPADADEDAEPMMQLRLDLALKSLAAAHLERTKHGARTRVAPNAEWTVELLRRLQIKATRQGDGSTDAAAERLLEMGIEVLQKDDATWNDARATVVRFFRKELPGLSVVVSGAPILPQDPSDEAIYFSLDRVESGQEQYLNVQIPPEFDLQQAHFRLLKSATSLMTLLQVYCDDSKSPSASSGPGRGRNPKGGKAARGPHDGDADRQGGLLYRLAAKLGTKKH